jgi:arylsulfatase A-like enzyme
MEESPDDSRRRADDLGHSEMKRSLPPTLPSVAVLCLALLPLLGCAIDRDLLPATSTNRIEAVLTVPREGRLDLEWTWNQGVGRNHQADVVEVWLQTGEGRGQLLGATSFESGDRARTMSIDLTRWRGETVLLRGVTRISPNSVQWQRARLTGRGLPAAGGAPAPEAGDRPPDVIVYMIDTLRPDVLGSYGGDVPTPHLDRIAAGGVVFENAYSTTSWTRPAIASIFSGMSIATHSVASEKEALPEEILTLAERFRLRGYQTFGVYANQHVTDVWHFDQGFERYLLPPLPPRPPQNRTMEPDARYDNIAAEAVHELVLETVAQHRDPRRPLFLWVHVVDPHMPYRPPRWALDEERPDLLVNPYLMRSINQQGAAPEVLHDLFLHYRGAVAYTDMAFGELLTRLDPLVNIDRSLLLVVSDHGEAFLEHGLVGHKSWIHEEQIRVPMILRGPGVPQGERVPDVVSLVDVLPTLLLLSGGAAAQPLQGQTLPLEPALGAPNRTVAAEHVHGNALRRGPWKLVQRIPQRQIRLFDLETDPLEARDLRASHPGVGEELERSLRRWRQECRQESFPAYQVSLDMVPESILQELRALGYLQ